MAKKNYLQLGNGEQITKKETRKMKDFVSKMTDIKNGEFIVDGRKWTCCQSDTGRPLVGFSAKGIWNDMTNGEEKKRIYKSDIAKYDVEKATKLFN